MSHSKERTQALIEGEASESGEFACPYCPEVYETALERDRCQASHFENTESISQPKADRRRNKKNLLEEWKT